MTNSVLDRQSELPTSIPLFRYAPERSHFSWREWDPSAVRTSDDLPQYLILGNLDATSVNNSPKGWSARWQGTEEDTHFDVAYRPDVDHWEVRQTWCGVDGGFSMYSTRVPLDKLIGQALYMQFPRSWDSAAKSQIESEYQLTIVEQPENVATFCGIPDGAFRTIVFPIAVRNLRPVRQWIEEIVEESPLTYPITVEAKLLFQAVNYLEGRAPEWTSQEAVAFNHSVDETGLAPHGFPVREVANDGVAAWTLRREIYFLFITLPFAGLTDFLSRMASENGPIRTTSGPSFRFELRPIVIPAAFEMQTQSLMLWDKPRTTRSFIQFSPPGEETKVPTIEQRIEAERKAPNSLAMVEAISDEVVNAIEQIFNKVTQRVAP